MSDPAPEWSRVGLRWVARLSAITSIVLFALVLVAIHRERLVHESTNHIVATFRLNNSYFDDRVDFAQTTRIRATAQRLEQTLEQLTAAAADDAALLATILPDTARLLAAAGADLTTARDLAGIADELHTTAGDILGTAGRAQDTVDAVHTRVSSIAALIEALNTELTRIDDKLPLPGRPEVPPR
jgi:hypothetical protein